ncbi:DyP-type peroxidase [Pleomassaria siparia CBS 279.74]|uniref:DyP-type peroxidase n=1 Tax=Pleomassaria siparia CBS 279.74 TaxID=1314801 RepID=A0A6G1JWH8_9PLEO|nr:DyP-type peroxidase [Pleomassaria siparia CBS 279.74]
MASLADIQGDIVVGLSKETELFFFFEILDVTAFRSQITDLIPLITTAEQAQKGRSDIRAFKAKQRKLATDGDEETSDPGTLPVVGVNIAFSAKGIEKMEVTGSDNIGDEIFNAGMIKDAKNLGDKEKLPQQPEYQPEWNEIFLQEIHGVILITGDTHHAVYTKLDEVKTILTKENTSVVREIATLVGDVRPGDQRGHEHFGYKDGISQPAIDGIDAISSPGQSKVDQGVVLVGRGGDDDANTRPSWALDGSFLAFRKLLQKVPEFNQFLVDKAPSVGDPTANVADLLGARLVGRWKSGAPVTEAPLRDDVDLGNDPQRNNDFTFIKGNQQSCPFAAHVRKMNPRGDLSESTIKPRLVARRGIPFGCEVTEEEKHTGKTQHERGLYFVCYQSNLAKGFNFLQKSWANEVGFPPFTPQVPGQDAIIGQTIHEDVRTVTGFDKDSLTQGLPLTAQWVTSENGGGEYFFSPSLPSLRNTFACSHT